jgi:hypothetical protein
MSISTVRDRLLLFGYICGAALHDASTALPLASRQFCILIHIFFTFLVTIEKSTQVPEEVFEPYCST